MNKILVEIKKKNPDSVLKLLKQPGYVEIVKRIRKDGILLYWAVNMGHYTVVRRLFELGADPNSKNATIFGCKPSFLLALNLKDSRILELFLKNKVNINMHGGGNYDALILLSLHKEGKSKKDKLDKLKLLIKHKIYLNHCPYYSHCALSHFLEHKENILSFFLIKRGADFDTLTNGFPKNTILMNLFSNTNLISYANLPVIQYIIENSKNFSHKNKNKLTLYDLIVRKTGKNFYLLKYRKNKQILSFLIALIKRNNK